MISSGIDITQTLIAMGAVLSNIADRDVLPYLTSSRPAYANFADSLMKARLHNPWFTEENITQAFTGLSAMLNPASIQTWLANYEGLPDSPSPKRIGLILAGNIPAVGFHDLLCVFVSGHRAVAKLSGQDNILLPALIELFESEIEGLSWPVEWQAGKLGPVDAIIATGSNNTARYFEYYFGKYPNIIRKNRTSVAILSGNETAEELDKLGDDLFSYFGLGCRNVSKVYLHKDFDIDQFFGAIYKRNEIVNHHKYANNYDYYKALWMMNQEPILDNGFVILRESEALTSPVGTVFYERFENEQTLRFQLQAHVEEIQCIVSLQDVPFGESQKPQLWDYADGVDTMAFLKNL